MCQKAFTSGSRGSGGTSANQERNEKDGEEFAPTKNKAVLSGEFPLHLLMITLPGTKLPLTAAALLQPVMAPDSLVLPSSELQACCLSSLPALQLPLKPSHKLTRSAGTKGTCPGCGMATGGATMPYNFYSCIKTQAGQEHAGRNSLSLQDFQNLSNACLVRPERGWLH